LANQEAIRFNHEYIGTEHILLGLVKEGTGVGACILKNLDLDLRKVRLEVEKLIKSGPDMVAMGKLPQTPRAKEAISYAIEEARSLGHNYVGTEHLLLGLLREEHSVAAHVLMELGLRLEETREEALNLSGVASEQDNSEGQLPTTDPLILALRQAGVNQSLGKLRLSYRFAWHRAGVCQAIVFGHVVGCCWSSQLGLMLHVSGQWFNGQQITYLRFVEESQSWLARVGESEYVGELAWL